MATTLINDIISYVRGTQPSHQHRQPPLGTQLTLYNSYINSIHPLQYNTHIPNQLLCILCVFNYLYGQQLESGNYDMLTTNNVSCILLQRADQSYHELIHLLQIQSIHGNVTLLKLYIQLCATYKITNSIQCIYVKLQGLYRTHIIGVNYNRHVVYNNILTLINDRNCVLVYHCSTQYYIMVGIDRTHTNTDTSTNTQQTSLVDSDAPMSDTDEYDGDTNQLISDTAVHTRSRQSSVNSESSSISDSRSLFDETTNNKPIDSTNNSNTVFNAINSNNDHRESSILVIQQTTMSDNDEVDTNSDSDSDTEIDIPFTSTAKQVEYNAISMRLNDILNDLESNTTSCIMKFQRT